MGQKVNPKGLRVGVIKDWDSNWFADKKDFSQLLEEDHKIRELIKNKLSESGLSTINIERTMGRIRITINTAKPGVVIGKDGASVTELKSELEKLSGKTVVINVEAIKNQDIDAQLVAERIAGDLERRITFRRAMKQAIQRTMRAGGKGIKTSVAGRLGGADMARTEHYSEGTIPLQTLRADIRYGEATARTQYGAIGVKVWIYLGEVLPGMKSAEEPKPQREERRGRRRNNNNRQGNNTGGNRQGRDNRNNRRNDQSNRGSNR